MSLFLPRSADHPVRKMFNSFSTPRDNIALHLVHFDEIVDEEGIVNNEYWTLRLYRDNFETFSKEDQIVIYNWVSDIIACMRIIEPRVYLEVFERMPR